MSGISRAQLLTTATKLILSLSGKQVSSDTLAAHQGFWGRFYHAFFTQVHRSYLLRSRGGSDDLGASWTPLKPKTVARKLRLAKRHKRVRSTRKKFLQQHLRTGERIWNFTYGSTFARLSATMGQSAARLEATRVAWGVVRSLGQEPALQPPTAGLAVPIMIDSGRLIRSYHPGRLIGNHYHSPREQVCRHEEQTVTVGTMVPYAEHAEKLRPVLHGGVGPWVRQALHSAIQGLLPRITPQGTIRTRSA